MSHRAQTLVESRLVAFQLRFNRRIYGSTKTLGQLILSRANLLRAMVNRARRCLAG